jgi:beta-glucanase (GH16 family)
MHQSSVLVFLLFFAWPFPGHSQQNRSPLYKKTRAAWSDEFNYRGLPDSTKWGYETGHIRNSEKQFYTSRTLKNARVKGGKLIIETRKEDNRASAFTSASLNTFGKKSFAGDFRLEVRARIPSGKGIWPAIWMMGINRFTEGYPQCSELDIMEFVGHTPGTVHGTVHWLDSTATQVGIKSAGAELKIDDLHRKYHVYSLERRGREITLFVDGSDYFNFTVPVTAYPGSLTSPLYLLINTALGGTWGRDVDESILPQKFIIDYVRVFNMDNF